MADVQPFRGLRYRTEDLGKELCPPYDVISSDEQSKLYELSPNNAIRLELGISDASDSDTDNRYTRAGQLLSSWVNKGVLIRDDTPTIYAIREKFNHDGVQKSRRSIFARVRLEEFSRGIVLPHEETSSGPKKDRLGLIKATNANLSPIMGIYRDNTGDISDLLSGTMNQTPNDSANYDQGTIELWAIEDTRINEQITNCLKNSFIYLADGHHRYETSLAYMEHQNTLTPLSESDPCRFILMCLIEIEDPGLIVLPYHRIMRHLSDAQFDTMLNLIRTHFEVQEFNLSDTPKPVHKIQIMQGQDQSCLGLIANQTNTLYILTRNSDTESHISPLEKCMTQFLGKNVIEPVVGSQQEAVEKGMLTYTHDSGELETLVLTGEWQSGFVLPPLSLDLFESVVSDGQRLPIKSTYFSPKLPTGLVINQLI